MKHPLLFIFALATTAMSFLSCDDTTDTIGMSLTESVNNVNVSADTFFVESHSVAAKDIVARSSNGYLGKIKDPETKSYVTCNYMTQFTTMGNYQFPTIDNIVVNNYDPAIPKGEQLEADSCELIVYFTRFYGDSLALMKVTAHELATPYEESETYKTDFDPIKEGMVRTGEGSIHSEMAYTISNRLHADGDRQSSTYTPYISISLNDKYKDKDGNEYSNYGTYLMRKFFNEQTQGCFGNNYRFTHEVCPGFYLEHIGGLGSLGTIGMTQIITYFQTDVNGTPTKSYTSFAGTEEVLRKTNITQDATALNSLITDNSCTYMKTPAGIFTELSMPIDKIMQGRVNEASHEDDTLNTVRLFIPRINDNKSTSYNLPIPKTILLLPTDSVNNFFNNKKVADSRTAYLATYSSTTNGYTFANISALVTKTYSVLNDTINSVLNAKKAELGTNSLTSEMIKTIKREVADKYMADHPTWNKVTLIPVETTYSTLSSGSSILTKVAYDMSLSSTRLQKGSQSNDNIIVSVIYSKFNN